MSEFKKVIRPKSRLFWSEILLYVIIIICAVFMILVGVDPQIFGDSPELKTKYPSWLSILLGIMGILIGLYEARDLLNNKAIFYENKLLLTGDKANYRKIKNKNDAFIVQYRSEIIYEQIVDVSMVASHKNSAKQNIHYVGRYSFVASMRYYVYFEFVLKNGKTKWMLLNNYSKKQRVEILDIINSKTGLSLDYDELLRRVANYGQRRIKNFEEDVQSFGKLRLEYEQDGNVVQFFCGRIKRAALVINGKIVDGFFGMLQPPSSLQGEIKSEEKDIKVQVLIGLLHNFLYYDGKLVAKKFML